MKNKEEIKKFYDVAYQNNYEGTPFNSNIEHTLPFWFGFMEYIKPFTKEHVVLEIGCGYGRQLFEFCKISDYVYGVDVAEGAKILSEEHNPKARVTVCDGKHIPFEDNTFDFLTAVFVFQHISKAHAINLLKESIRVLKPGGRFLFEFLGGNYIGGEGNDHYSGGLQGMYNNGYTVEELKKIEKELNLKTIHITEIDMSSLSEKGTTNIWWEVIK